MFRFFNLLFFLSLAGCLLAQNNWLNFSIEKFGSRQELWVNNNSYATLTVRVEFTVIENCYTDNLEEFYLIESFEKKKLADIVQSETSKAWKWNYRYWWKLGSAIGQHSDQLVYQLPYKSGSNYKVIQGYNGNFSHFGEIAYAIDFDMPENTMVLASRGGIVVQTEDSFSEGGVDEYYRNKVNMVRIQHADGTIGNYYHFIQNGILVRPGQRVETGQEIGYSGNTGYSSTPHLHFDVSKPVNAKLAETVAVKFLINENNAEELIQGNSYTAP